MFQEQLNIYSVFFRNDKNKVKLLSSSRQVIYLFFPFGNFSVTLVFTVDGFCLSEGLCDDPDFNKLVFCCQEGDTVLGGLRLGALLR